jgi:protein-S-isoprenylcysteine O-methyltransferase Ste14
MMIWAWWLFRQRGNPICPTEAAHEMISAGPYSVTRNPMYLGILAILSGASLIMGSIPALVAPVGFFLIDEQHIHPRRKKA